MNKVTKTTAALSVSAAALSGVAAPASAREASATVAGIWDSLVLYGPAEAIYNLTPDSRLFYRVTHPYGILRNQHHNYFRSNWYNLCPSNRQSSTTNRPRHWQAVAILK